MQGAEGPEHCMYLPFYTIKKEMVSKKIEFTIYLHIIQSMVFGIYWHNYSDVAYVPSRSEGQAEGLCILIKIWLLLISTLQ